jgi:hypothetical protein
LGLTRPSNPLRGDFFGNSRPKNIKFLATPDPRLTHGVFLYYFRIKWLSQNFSFWKAALDFEGKNGLFAVFPKAIPKINRVLRWL